MGVKGHMRAASQFDVPLLGWYSSAALLQNNCS